jgi:hypothetical protein
MCGVRAETDVSLYNALLFSVSTSDETGIKFRLFSPTLQSHAAFMLVTVERGDGVAVHNVRTAIYASP